MATLPSATTYWRVKGAGDSAWTLDADGTFTPTAGATVEVVTVGPSSIAEIVADTTPAISGLADLSATYGASVTINAALKSSGSNLAYSMTGPAWLSINPSTGSITGTAPSADVSATATVTVSNSAGSASNTFAVSVADAPSEGSIAFTVNNSAGTSQTDFQVRVPVTFVAGMQSDFSDVHFTDMDGTTALSCWLESKTDGVSAVFWVKLPTMPASVRTIYANYGGGAQSRDGRDTFDLFAGFDLGVQLTNAAAPQTTPTYDGSGQAVHPSVVEFATAWNGYRFWMGMTPYTYTNDQLENPSILASNDGATWVVPAGVTNPLAQAPAGGHNNDTHLVYNSTTDELWLYYLDTRRTSEGGDNTQRLVLFKSADGATWTKYGDVITWNLSTDPLYVCPTIIVKDGTWHMWALANVTYVTYHWTSADGISWGAPTATNLAVGWHFDIKYIPGKNEYLALLTKASSGESLYAARSTDGLNFGIPQLIMARRVGQWDENIYRPCFIYDAGADLLKIWYSAFASSVWRIGYTQIADYDALLPPTAQTDLDWTRVAGTTPVASSVAALRGSGGLLVNQPSANGSVNFKKSLPASDNIVVEWDMYDDMDSTALKMLRVASATPQSVGVGVYNGASATKYCYHSKTSTYTATTVDRSLGWHKFAIEIINAGTANFYIDGTLVGTLTGQLATVATVNLAGSSTNSTAYYVDDLRVRKAASVYPTVSAA